MKGAVIYSENKERAAEVCSFLGAKLAAEMKLRKYEELDVGALDCCDYIAVEWSLRNRLVLPLMRMNNHVGIVFFNEMFIADIDVTSEMEIQLENALESKDYATCKGINEFFLFADIIRKHNVLKSRPSVLQVESTDLCNAKCIMCTHVYDSGTGIKILESGLIERLEPILPFVKTIILHGNGEPFMTKNIVSYLEQFSEFGIKFLSNTNLSILDEELLNIFHESFVELSVSCDGYDKESYEAIRVGLCFETFVANCKRVRAKCPQLYMKMAVVVMRQNLGHLDKILAFAYELGFNEVDFNQLCVDEKLGNVKDDPYLYKEKYVEAIKSIQDMADALPIKVSIPALSHGDDPESRRNLTPEGPFVKGLCDWIAGQAFINLHGDMAICCINQKIIMGNVFRQSIEEVWNCGRYRDLRQCLYTGRLPTFCSGCDFLLQNRMRFMRAEHDITFEQLKKAQMRQGGAS